MQQEQEIIAIFKRIGPDIGAGWVQGGGTGEVRFYESADGVDEGMRSAHLFGPFYVTVANAPVWNPSSKRFDAFFAQPAALDLLHSSFV